MPLPMCLEQGLVVPPVRKNLQTLWSACSPNWAGLSDIHTNSLLEDVEVQEMEQGSCRAVHSYPDSFKLVSVC